MGAGGGSEETLSLPGGKWSFPRRKVGVCSEESQRSLKGAKIGCFYSQSYDSGKFPTNSLILQRT